MQIENAQLYDAVSLFNFMYKKSIKNILQHLLVRSPQQAHSRINKLCYNSASLQKISFQSYVDNLLSNIYCDFFISNQFNLVNTKPSQILKHYKKIQTLPLSQRLIQMQQKYKMEQKIMCCIKKLHQEKQNISTYVQMEDVLLSMNGSDITKLKNYLIFIYRLIRNQQGRLTQQIDQLCQRLKGLVVTKLSEGFTLEQQQNQVDAELKKAKMMSKARQYSKKGNKQKAKKYYQKILQNESMDENAKMQALQYLCKQGYKNKDWSYLLGMRIKIRQQYIGSDMKHRYIEYLENFLQKVAVNAKSQNIIDQIQ